MRVRRRFNPIWLLPIAILCLLAIFGYFNTPYFGIQNPSADHLIENRLLNSTIIKNTVVIEKHENEDHHLFSTTFHYYLIYADRDYREVDQDTYFKSRVGDNVTIYLNWYFERTYLFYHYYSTENITLVS